MALSERPTSGMLAPASGDPAERSRPWPVPVVLLLALAGLISPFICFAGAAAAYALADRDQGNLLAGVGLVHLLIGLTFFPGF